MDQAELIKKKVEYCKSNSYLDLCLLWRISLNIFEHPVERKFTSGIHRRTESLLEEHYKMDGICGVQEDESAGMEDSFILKEQHCFADRKVHSKTFLGFVFIF